MKAQSELFQLCFLFPSPILIRLINKSRWNIYQTQSNNNLNTIFFNMRQNNLTFGIFSYKLTTIDHVRNKHQDSSTH